MNQTRENLGHEPRDQPAEESQDDGMQTLWQWFAVGLLVFCWIAEASMCADRGF